MEIPSLTNDTKFRFKDWRKLLGLRERDTLLEEKGELPRIQVITHRTLSRLERDCPIPRVKGGKNGQPAYGIFENVSSLQGMRDVG